ncbi:hypothetical protein Trydic_g7876 [Trypoxylus dichotomus]
MRTASGFELGTSRLIAKRARHYTISLVCGKVTRVRLAKDTFSIQLRVILARGKGHYSAGKVDLRLVEDMKKCGDPPPHQRNWMFMVPRVNAN